MFFLFFRNIHLIVDVFEARRSEISNSQAQKNLGISARSGFRLWC